MVPSLGLAAPGKPLIMSFSSRSVLLSWTPAISPVSEYMVRVRQGEEGDWADARTVPTASNASEFNVTGLRPFTVYSFKVVALTEEEGREESEASYYMITLREAPSGMPTITSAYNTSSSSVFLAWAPPHPATIHGEMLGYRLGYGPRYADMEEWRWRELAGDVTRIQLEELHPFTQYLVSLQVIIDHLLLSLPKTNLMLVHLTNNSDDHFQVLNPEGGGPLARVVVITDEDGQYFLSFLSHQHSLVQQDNGMFSVQLMICNNCSAKCPTQSLCWRRNFHLSFGHLVSASSPQRSDCRVQALLPAGQQHPGCHTPLQGHEGVSQAAAPEASDLLPGVGEGVHSPARGQPQLSHGSGHRASQTRCPSSCGDQVP